MSMRIIRAALFEKEEIKGVNDYYANHFIRSIIIDLTMKNTNSTKSKYTQSRLKIFKVLFSAVFISVV